MIVTNLKHLQTKCESVSKFNFNEGERIGAQLLKELTKSKNGIGLAANQVGILKRLIVMDCSTDDEDPNLIKMINPEIIFSSTEISELEEGCLSIPEHKSIVKRPSNIKVRFLNTQGSEEIIDAEGLLSACIQHEIDHLNGVLFVDHISRLKRDIILRKVKKQIRENEK